MSTTVKKLSKEDLVLALERPIEEGRIVVLHDVHDLFEVLGRSFPTVGNSIDWKNVPGAVSAGEIWAEEVEEKFAAFMTSIVKRQGLSGRVYALCDSTDEIAFRGDLADLVPYLRLIAELPEKLYALPDGEVSWCACLSFEGWMDFGYSPGDRPESVRSGS